MWCTVISFSVANECEERSSILQNQNTEQNTKINAYFEYPFLFHRSPFISSLHCLLLLIFSRSILFIFRAMKIHNATANF